ncbi:MAG: TIGR02597 family protein [Verrucomicrobiae bacterium]|nr:TIGR02597 family protein [Verrucomicrobiae bacterium]
MKLAKLSRLTLLFAISGAFSIQAFAIEAVTNPVGVIQKTALGDSDTLISIPLKRPAVFNGVVASISGATLTAEGSPGWTANEWAGAYYAFARSGGAAGGYAMIESNTANSVTFEEALDGSGLAQGDSFSIHPFWTLGTLFPDGAGVHESANHVNRDTEIFIPDAGGLGTNLGAETTFYYYNGAFHQVGAALDATFDDAPLLPDTYFVLRNNTSTATTVTFTGEVVMGSLSLPLLALDAGEQDNVVGLQRPIEMTLDESGLGASLEPGDQLLVWDDSTPKQNRPLSDATVYTWDGSSWSGGNAGGADEVFTPGRGVLIRRGATGSISEVDWQNSPNYGN